MDYLYGFKKGQALFFEKEPVPCGKSLSPGDWLLFGSVADKKCLFLVGIQKGTGTFLRKGASPLREKLKSRGQALFFEKKPVP